MCDEADGFTTAWALPDDLIVETIIRSLESQSAEGDVRSELERLVDHLKTRAHANNERPPNACCRHSGARHDSRSEVAKLGPTKRGPTSRLSRSSNERNGEP